MVEKKREAKAEQTMPRRVRSMAVSVVCVRGEAEGVFRVEAWLGGQRWRRCQAA